MIYTDKTKLAMKIAFDAHINQVDKGGMPYIFHPIHLAEQMDTESETIIALLHDVVEDTNITFNDLEEYGFSKEVLDALKLLTHTDLEYMDYVKKIKENETARKVKICDLRHNLDTTRNNGIKPKKYETYLKALAYLEEN